MLPVRPSQTRRRSLPRPWPPVAGLLGDEFSLSFHDDTTLVRLTLACAMAVPDWKRDRAAHATRTEHAPLPAIVRVFREANSVEGGSSGSRAHDLDLPTSGHRAEIPTRRSE